MSISRLVIVVLLSLLIPWASIAPARSTPPYDTSSGAELPGGVVATPEAPRPATVTPRAGLHVPDDFAADVDRYANGLVKANRFGGAILVGYNGQILFSKGYGKANYELDVSNTGQTRFRLASLTKQFTAFLIMKLQEQGKLQVQDHVCQYLADCPYAWRTMIIDQLLTHTSGLPDIVDLPGFYLAGKQPASPADLLDRLRTAPMNAFPGQGYGYSNSNYIVLGYLIEQITGKTYADVLQQMVFDPLDMKDSGVESYELRDRAVSNLATGYTILGQTRSDPLDMTNFYAAGAIYSTAEDLYRWEHAFDTGQLLSQRSLDDMLTPRVPMWQNAPWVYAYGWVVDNDPPRRQLFHFGFVSGYSNFVDRYPDQGMTIIVLSNWEYAPSNRVAGDIAALLWPAK